MGKTNKKLYYLSIDFKGHNNQRYYTKIYPLAESLKFGLYFCADRMLEELIYG